MSAPPVDDEVNKIIANLNKQQSRDSDSNIYGEDYYNNPLTNDDYTETTGELNIDKLLYSIANPNDAQTPLIAQSQMVTSVFEGHVVITDVFEAQNLSIDALAGMDAPQYYAEPGYLVSFRLAVNDPLMALKVQAKGYGENSYTIADYSMRKMAILGLGMTLGEAEEVIFTDEGETSRDLSGAPSTEYPYLVRYKHLPTGTETDYELYKGTDNDVWIVAQYTPKVYPKFSSLFFDIFNGNPTGPRLIHNLQIKRYIIMDTKKMLEKPDLTKSVLGIDTNKLLTDLLKEDKIVPDVDTPLPISQPVISEVPTPTVTSNYTLRRKNGVMRKVPVSLKKPKSLVSIPKEQQQNPLFKDAIADEVQAYNTLMRQNYRNMRRLKSQ